MDLRALGHLGGPLGHVRRPHRLDARAPSRRPRSRRRESQDRAAPSRPKRPRGAPTQVAIVDGANEGETVSARRRADPDRPGPDAAIRLDDDYVSTRHARIASSGDQWFVEDLGSTNGTYLGSHRLTQPTTLQLGSEVRIGKTTLELRK